MLTVAFRKLLPRSVVFGWNGTEVGRGGTMCHGIMKREPSEGNTANQMKSAERRKNQQRRQQQHQSNICELWCLMAPQWWAKADKATPEATWPIQKPKFTLTHRRVCAKWLNACGERMPAADEAATDIVVTALAHRQCHFSQHSVRCAVLWHSPVCLAVWRLNTRLPTAIISYPFASASNFSYSPASLFASRLLPALVPPRRAQHNFLSAGLCIWHTARAHMPKI